MRNNNLLTDHTLIIDELERSINYYSLNSILSFLPKGSYLVGGYIRDIILGRLTEDIDIDSDESTLLAISLDKAKDFFENGVLFIDARDEVYLSLIHI